MILQKIYDRVWDRFIDWRMSFHFPKKPEDWKTMKAVYDGDTLYIGKWEVMQEWERPLMQALAREATRTHGHVLEVGFGMGISASFVMEFGCSRYTVIEPHPTVIEKARDWASQQPSPVEIVQGFWQNEIHGLGKFDAILFDSFPLKKEDAGRNHVPFFEEAREHLNPGGVFTYYSDAEDSLPDEDLKLLLDIFDEVRLYKVRGLEPPRRSQYWGADTMVVPVCTVH